MKKKPIIGIIGRTDIINEISIIQTNENYRLSIIKAGGLPIIIVPVDDEKYDQTTNPHRKLKVKEKSELLQIMQLCDGIMMTGGTIWHEFDEFICNFAIKNDIPILGICLGMQIIANMDNFCGTLESDQTIKNQSQLNHFQEKNPLVHKITILPGDLKEILKEDTLIVNSRHDYHIIKKDSFHIDAYSEDGLIEAISLPNCKFAVGIQWHPEDMIEYEPRMLEIFKKFINMCK